MLKTRASKWGIFLLVLGLLGAVTWLLYFSGKTTPSYIHLFYVPIIIASFFLGVALGLFAAAAAAILSLLSNHFWGVPPLAAGSDFGLDIFIRTVFFFTIGLLISFLAALLRRKADEASALFAASHAVNQSLRLEEILPNMAKMAAEIGDGKASVIRLLSSDGDELIPAASWGLSEGYLEKGPVHLTESPLDEEVMKGKVLWLHDVRKDPRFQYHDAAGREGLVSCICVPIQRGGRFLGVLRIYSDSPRCWDRSDQRLLCTLAGEMAVAIENSRLHETLRRSYWETVRALTRAIEAKDPQMLGHAERATDYALQIGQALGLASEDMENLRFAATLHDIGMIAVEEQLMRVSNPQAYREALMSNHPLVGMSILQPAEFLRPALDGVRYHHERYDGSGYPDGLKGEEIPLLARIVAVANEYDYLTHPAWGIPPVERETALIELEKSACTILDPRIVSAFVAVMRKAEPK